jgi:predicted acyl esterase
MHIGRALRLATLAVAVVGLGMATIAVRSYLASDTVVHVPRVPVSPEASARAFAEIPGLKDVSFRTSDGLTLRGWFTPGRRRAAIILTGGIAANRTQLYPDGLVLARHGYGVLLYDSRASGASDGERVTWGDREERDVAAALNYVTTRPEVDPDRVALLGFSAGGSTSTLAAASDPRVRAIILYATWSSLEDEMKNSRGKYGPLSWALFSSHSDATGSTSTAFARSIESRRSSRAPS